MRKKVIALTLAACLIAVIGLTGCGQEKPYGKYDLSEYVTVGEYKGLEREELHVSVSDEEVDTQVNKNVEDTKTTKQVKEGKVKKGDTAMRGRSEARPLTAEALPATTWRLVQEVLSKDLKRDWKENRSVPLRH